MTVSVLVVNGVTGEDMALEAFETATPGVVVLWHPIDEVWTITHAVSGLRIAWSDSPEHAMFIAEALAPVTDWTQPGSVIAADETTRQLVIDITGQHPQPSHGDGEMRERCLARGAAG